MTEFYKIMLRLIDRSSKKVAASELSILKYELQCHLWILKEACDWFVGREKEIEEIKDYITGLSKSCFVVYGPPGSGKCLLYCPFIYKLVEVKTNNIPVSANVT